MPSLERELTAALFTAATGAKRVTLRARATTISTRYRSGQINDEVVGMTDDLDALAFAIYRMPATYRALVAALAAADRHVGNGLCRTHVDLGGGTGAGAWAAASVWPGVRTEVVERRRPAIRLGQRLLTAQPMDVQWTLDDLRSWAPPTEVDLVTIGYVLNELEEPVVQAVLQAAARVAKVVVIVEPGTPDGYHRILEARRELTESGLTIAAPCPHQGPCPLSGKDWCHFAVRVRRTELHRELKQGSRNFEDEKFAYLVATREPANPASSRVITRPLQRHGHVVLDLCTADGVRQRLTVSKSQKADYPAARSTTWGDLWP
jgi:ribosomal protein RSM22 (predicted rRNA methylase)